MKPGLWILAKQAYKIVLRPLLKKAIDDPTVTWDDAVLKVLDAIFEYVD